MTALEAADMETEIEIRAVGRGQPEATDEEVDGFHALVNEPQQREWDPGGEGLDPQAVAEFLRRLTPSRPGQAVFLAKAGGRVVGMSAVFTGPGDPAKIGFGVSSDWQGLGLGRLLVDHALCHARACRLDRLVAEVLPHNLRAIKLLTSVGFSATADWAGADEGLMTLEIAP